MAGERPLSDGEMFKRLKDELQGMSDEEFDKIKLPPPFENEPSQQASSEPKEAQTIDTQQQSVETGFEGSNSQEDLKMMRADVQLIKDAVEAIANVITSDT